MNTPNISRRSLAKGVAWSAPVVAVTTMIPAYAASSTCIRSTIAGGETFFNYGEDIIGVANLTDVDASITNMWLGIDGLDKDETVQSLNFTWYVEALDSRMEASYDQGFYYPPAEGAQFTDAALDDGWTRTTFSTPENITLDTNQGSITKNMWSLEFTNTANVGTYETGENGCVNFTTTNVVADGAAFEILIDDVEPVTNGPGDYAPAQVFYWTVVTNKRTIEYYAYIYDNDIVNGTTASKNAGESDNYTGT